MRTTIDVPDAVMNKVKLRALGEGVTMKAWFVERLRSAVDGDGGKTPPDEAARFRKRFRGRFEPAEMDGFKRAGRA